MNNDIQDEKSPIGKVRVIFLGGRELGCRILEWMIIDPRFKVVGVVASPCSELTILKGLIKKYSLQEVYELEDLKNIEFDIGISINYHKILCKTILQLAPLGFWNIHHSYNMRLRGRNITTHAILLSKANKLYYHGTSLHKMIEDLDAGPIVASYSTPILPEDTAYSLFSRVNDLAFDLFTDWIPRIAYEKIYPYESPVEGIMMFKNKDLPSKEISTMSSNDEIFDKIRAFDFPGQDPAFVWCNGKKINLVVNKRDEFIFPVNIFGKVVFSDKSI